MGGAAVTTVVRLGVVRPVRLASRAGRIPLSAHVPRAGLRPPLLLYFAARGTHPTRPACSLGDRANVLGRPDQLRKLWVLGGPRSEVKGEAAALWPTPEDMSGGDCTTPTAREAFPNISSQQPVRGEQRC
jgi:hypothetical protein